MSWICGGRFLFYFEIPDVGGVVGGLLKGHCVKNPKTFHVQRSLLCRLL